MTFHSEIGITKIDSIKEYDQYGIPKKVEYGISYELFHTDGSKALKRIYFFKETKGYTWISTNDTLKTLPKDFSTPGWYYVLGIRSFDRTQRNLLYHLSSKGKVKVYYWSHF